MPTLREWEDLGPFLNRIPAGELVAIYDGKGVSGQHLLLFRMPTDVTFGVALLCQPGTDHLDLYTPVLKGVYFPVYSIVKKRGVALAGELSDLLIEPSGTVDLADECFHSNYECDVAVGEEEIKSLKTIEEFSHYLNEFLKGYRSPS